MRYCVLRKQQISIHAPAKGATVRGWKSKDKWEQFQSTLPRGERPINTMYDMIPSLFQSTLPRGERQLLFGLLRTLRFYFNPRSREGSDD